MSEESSNQINLPDDILDFLSEIDSVRFAQEFVKLFGLKEQDVSRVMIVIEDLVYGDFPIESLPTELQTRFKLSETDAKKGALEIAEKRLMSIKEHLPKLLKQIGLWGGDLSKIEQSTSEGKGNRIDTVIFVRDLIAKLPLELESHLFSRLENIIESYLLGRSTKEKTVETLMRAQKTAGMGFEKMDAENLLDFVNKNKQNVVLSSIIPEKKPEPIKEDVKSTQTIDEKPIKKIEPEKELTPVAKEMKPILIDPEVEQKTEHKPVVDPIVQKPTKPLNVIFSKEDEQEIEQIKKEKQTVFEISKDHPQTISEMTNFVCQDPIFSFTDKTLEDRCRQIVDLRLRDVRTPQDTRNSIERAVEQGGLGINGRKLSDITSAIEKGFDEIQQRQAKVIQEDRETKRAETKSREMAKMEAKIDVGKMRVMIEEVKKIPEPLPQIQTVKSKVEDVRFVKRLSGPIDELKQMTLVDFRRLSKNPMDATQKIKDQVELLEDQGFQKQVDAIRAWQTSPVNQMYVELTKKSLMEGISLEEARTQKEQQKEPTLTKEELVSIIKLNGELRF